MSSNSISDRVLLLVFLLVAVASGQQLNSQTVSVEGYVRDAVTMNPIAEAAVSLNLPSWGARVQTRTDPMGRFQLNGIPAGSFVLYAAKDDDSVVRTFSATAGQNLRNVEFRIPPWGVVSGRVTDSAGRPVVGSRISLFEIGYNRFTGNTSPDWMAAQDPGGSPGWPTGADSDDRGQFRVRVRAGRYIVQIQPPDSTPQNANPHASLGVIMYPNTQEIAKATLVEVIPGQETRLAPVIMTPSPLEGKLRVRVTNETGEQVAQQALVQTFRGRQTVTWEHSRSINLTPQAWPNLTSKSVELQPFGLGTYLIVATWVSDRRQQTWTAWSVSVEVDYKGTDVDVELIVKKPTGLLTGSVKLEGQLTQSLRIPHGTFLIHEKTQHWTSLLTMPDGTFNHSSLFPGVYELDTRDLPSEYYLLSARQGERDALRTGVVVSDSSVPLEIVMSPIGAVVEGKVTDANGQPLADALVSLVGVGPLAERSDKNGTQRTTYSDQDGNYRFKGLAAGPYQLHAWASSEMSRSLHRIFDPAGRFVDSFSSVEDGAFLDPEFLKKFQSRERTTTVERNGLTTVNLQLD